MLKSIGLLKKHHISTDVANTFHAAGLTTTLYEVGLISYSQ